MVYGRKLSHANGSVYTSDQWRQIQASAESPQWVIVFYDAFLKRDQPALWQNLQRVYTPYAHLPGRVSPVLDIPAE